MSKDKVLRGGSYDYAARGLRTTFRYYYVPVSRYRSDGFRLVAVRRKQWNGV